MKPIPTRTNPPRRAIAEAEARRIIEKLRILSPDEINLEAIAMHFNVRVRERSLSGCEARIVREENKGVISIKNSISPYGRKRFAIAHELGHFFLHPDTKQLSRCTDADFHEWGHKKREEVEANIFAAELLMPERILAPCITGQIPSLALIAKLANDFATSLTATAIRFITLTKEPCALIASDGTTRNWTSFSPAFLEDFKLLETDEIHKYSCVSDTPPSLRSPISDSVPAGAWLKGYSATGKESIREDCVQITPDLYLSLIWIDEEL